MKFVKAFLILLTAFIATYSNDTLRVDVAEFPPFVMVTDGTVTGLEIDLWNTIADENDIVFEYNVIEQFSEIFDGVEAGEADVALAGITITAEREDAADFVHSHITTGLGVMYERNSIFKHLGLVISSNVQFYTSLIINLIPFVIVWMLYVYIIAAILWKLEIGNEMFNDNFKQGFPDAKFFVHVVISSTGFGNQIPMSKWGRRIAIILMYSGIGLMFPLITGKISSEFSKKPEIVYIDSIQDLDGKRVAVIEGSTSVAFIKSVGATPVFVADVYEARYSLKAEDCDAVVFDRPALLYIAQQDADLIVIEETFNDEAYGIALPEGSPLLEMINRSVLTARGNGMIDNLKLKWF